MPKGGVVLPTTAAPGSWLMAQYFATGDPGWIVPIQSLERGPPSFNLQAFKRFGVGYPDQELVSAIVGRCVDPKDSARHKEGRKVLFSAAHGSGLDAWRFVSKANMKRRRSSICLASQSRFPLRFSRRCTRLLELCSRRTEQGRSILMSGGPQATSVGRLRGTGWSTLSALSTVQLTWTETFRMCSGWPSTTS